VDLPVINKIFFFLNSIRTV